MISEIQYRLLWDLNLETLKSSHEKRALEAGGSDPRDVPFNLYGEGYTVLPIRYKLYPDGQTRKFYFGSCSLWKTDLISQECISQNMIFNVMQPKYRYYDI